MSSAGSTRIAPTPSGFLHAGNAINFLLIQKLAKLTGSELHLRIDDLDRERVRPEYVEDVFRSLEWLGISWNIGPRDPEDLDLNWSQQLRLPRYFELLQALRELDVLYGCTCTRSSSQSQAGNYPGTCREKGIDLDDPAAAWRIRIPESAEVEISDLGGGSQRINVARSIGDVVLRQRPIHDRPAMAAYQIASLADDRDRGITMIVRGNDLLPSTALQIHLAQLLGLESFTRISFVHHPLIVDPEGRKLSKSEGASSLKSMREQGLRPIELREQADALFDRLIGGKLQMKPTT